MTARGNYSFAKWKSSGARLFGRDKRNFQFDDSETRKISPGPGTYAVPSDFGVYDPNESIHSVLESRRDRISSRGTPGSRRELVRKSPQPAVSARADEH